MSAEVVVALELVLFVVALALGWHLMAVSAAVCMAVVIGIEATR